jgi:hypothetical protein
VYLPYGQRKIAGVFSDSCKEGNEMVTLRTFLKRYRLASLLMFEGGLALASIARSVISSWERKTAATRRGNLRLGVKK